MDMVHTLTGPVFVEGAEPGDILAIELLMKLNPQTGLGWRLFRMSDY